MSKLNVQIKHSLSTGFSFGLTSGIITTLGLMVGLHAGTHSKLAVVWGLLVLTIFSYYLALEKKESPLQMITEHVAIAILTIVTTHYFGDWVNATFR